METNVRYDFRGTENHSSQFFDGNFGNFEGIDGNFEGLKQEEYAIHNPWKNRTFIHHTDSWTDTIKKIILMVATLGGSLMISAVHDHFYTPDDATLQKYEKTLEGRQAAKANSIVDDVFRSTITFNGVRLEDMAWEEMSEDQWKNIEGSLKSVLGWSDNSIAIVMKDLRQKDTPQEGIDLLKVGLGAAIEGSKLETVKQSIQNELKKVLKEEVLPEIFEELEQKHGKLRALQIFDMYFQTLGNQFNALGMERFVNNKLENQGILMGGDGLGTSLNLDTESNQLTLNTTYDFKKFGAKGSEVVAKMPTRVVVDLSREKVTGKETRFVKILDTASEVEKAALKLHTCKSG